MSEDTKWVHTSGEDDYGLCLQCAEDIEWEPANECRPHDANPAMDTTADDPYCDVCGHSIDLVMA